MTKKTTKSQPKPAKNEQIKKKQQKQVKPKKYTKTIDAKFRIQKSKNQRIFVLSAQKKQDQWIFTVQGTNCKMQLYGFHYEKKPCKHIYFIVTQVAQNEQILDYFKNSTSISKNAYKVLDQQLQKRLRSRLEAMNSNDKNVIDLKDDTDCVICFTQMNKDQQKLQDCNKCKKYFHSECIARWKDHNPTCPLCRGSLMGSGNNPLDKLQKIVV